MSDGCSLKLRHCLPCEGGVPPLTSVQTQQWLEQVSDWTLSDDGKSIYRKLNRRNFVDAIALLNQIAELSETEQHHPDLHLTGYRKVRIELTTHAIGGLSENDFILAAKIDELVGSL